MTRVPSCYGNKIQDTNLNEKINFVASDERLVNQHFCYTFCSAVAILKGRSMHVFKHQKILCATWNSNYFKLSIILSDFLTFINMSDKGLSKKLSFF